MFDGAIHVTCKHCQATNRLQVSRLLHGPRCGRCHAPLLGSEVMGMNDPTGLARQNQSARRVAEDGDSP